MPTGEPNVDHAEHEDDRENRRPGNTRECQTVRGLEAHVMRERNDAGPEDQVRYDKEYGE